MSPFIDSIRARIPYDSFSDTELLQIFPGSKDRLYGLVKRALARRDFIHLRRGVYCLAEPYRRRPLNLFVLAQKLYGPSYISYETALVHHGWIPEAVYTTTSAARLRTRAFHTPLGIFHFTTVPLHGFMTAVERCVVADEVFFMARPWRAIVDYMRSHRKSWRGVGPLLHDLRLDEEQMHTTTAEELNALAAVNRSRPIVRFLNRVRKDLQL
ncbi:MAG: hypothetical protein HY696_10995 [Deltaproteobacteria bacterium]|nr:hypothetical protein [Deltaproteobacteria bacterium]